MTLPDRTALFIMQGRAATKTVVAQPGLSPDQPLMLAWNFNLGTVLPVLANASADAAEGYRLFFVFEGYLRDFVQDVMQDKFKDVWWDQVPLDVRNEVDALAEKEETKLWMATPARGKAALLTYPQLLTIIDRLWKDGGFEPLLRDKLLIQEARGIGHLRNTICHMTPIPPEEFDRVRLVMRDWFRAIPP